jgi:riboflavin kinase / FMN adenylyltransferase
MQIFEDVSLIEPDKNTIVTIGTFDGIHLGHKKIIDRINERVSETGGRSFLITFNPHPRNVLAENYRLKILTTLDEKKELLGKSGIENILVINFTKEFSQLSSGDFIRKYIVNGTGACEVVIGHDHHFGKGRSGNEETLKEIGSGSGFTVSKVDPFEIDGEIVSSTKIRNALNEGDLKRANKLLGRYYSFRGKVIEGDKRGRLLGFPTANIQLDEEEKLLPSLGIYFVEVLLNEKKHYGLLSIGKRPTFYTSGKIVPEVYIYDFDKDIYGEDMEVKLIERLRGEEKYNTADELIVQMYKDKENGIKVLNKIINPG